MNITFTKIVGFFTGAIITYLLANLLRFTVLAFMASPKDKLSFSDLFWWWDQFTSPTGSILLCTIVGGLCGAKWLHQYILNQSITK
ncbi:MAG: hypothetical protein CL568_01560 [Alphaproteobacteria bacterium]|nr:hypothetical protein [Alphaproteobacteria bacterium]